VRRYVDVPLILENITYMVTLPGAEMTEAQFLTEVVERSDCGLLLDITNLHINAVNHNYDVGDFFSQLPLERIVQLHFVGGHWHNGVLIDSHSHSTPKEVWQLMDKVVAKVPVKGIVLERDENLPPFAELPLNWKRRVKLESVIDDGLAQTQQTLAQLFTLLVCCDRVVFAFPQAVA
jgi:uncharacterized protein (UPF0276 family)